MLDEYSKCRFCKWHDDYDGCEAICNNYNSYEPNKYKLIEKSQETGLRISDIVTLINMEDDNND